MEVKHRMTELLEHTVNADVQLSFCSLSESPCPKPVSEHGYSHVTSFPSLGNDFTLQTHLCVLKTVGTVPMERLLNTYPPSNQNRPSRSSVHVEHGGDDINAMEPIREIRFEDSPPAAVEAVVRYIYLGQQPVLEPLCGYTVKDLMSLASYLEIERLQDHCVELVLGMSAGHHRLPYRRVTGQPQQQQQPQRHRRYQKQKSRIGAETAVQILFGWGYRFPKIRHALIQALIHDNGYAFADGKLMALERFREHKEYNAIVYELAAEQFSLV
ncbi:hypothetical protein BGX26_001273 [Mortierella sp. AD094]|nr:hypothetical protein BGX26_001273 [Mortierella sp. AD094]